MRRLVLLAFLLTNFAAAEDALHVYYYNGETIEQMSMRGVTVTVTLKDTGKMNQLAVYVDNSSSDAVNVLPSSFALHQSLPKDLDLVAKSPEDVRKLAGKQALWGPVVTGISPRQRQSNREERRVRQPFAHLRGTGAMAFPCRRARAKWQDRSARSLVFERDNRFSRHAVCRGTVVRPCRCI